MERVLVTGAGGFVGRHLRAELGEAFVPYEGDVLDAASLAAAVRGVDGVVHLAAAASVGESFGGAGEVWRTNVLGTVNVVEAIRAEAPAGRLLLASSGDVYGRAEVVPTPEEAPLAPVSPYAASKAAAELACVGVDAVIARAFPHTGPGQDERFAVGSWSAQLARLRAEGGGTLRVGDLEVERDLTDVRDVCRAYRLLLRAPAGTYNVCSGRAVPLRRVVELLVEAAAVPVAVERDDERVRPAEVPVLAGDPSKLRAATGWEPRIPLEQTLADALDAAAHAEAVGR